MAWTRYQILLAVTMVVTGSINTLSAKWADEMEAAGKDGVVRKFEHPFMQASCMFLGELLCLFTFKIMYAVLARKRDGSEDVHTLTKGNRDFNPFIFFIPAMCDMTATSLMYIGLTLTYASSFQMIRGAVIIFVALLSMGFLRKVIKRFQWIGIGLIIVGLALVGVADFVNRDTGNDGPGPMSILTGDMLILMAQIITASQMVIEEKFVSSRDIPPLQAVGWEGLFGFIVLGLLQIPMYFIHVGKPFSNNSRGVLEDTLEAFVQISNNKLLVLSLSGTIISIAFFNFAGISVTKEISATTRMVLDSTRTLVIWIVSLAAFGQKFHYLQLIGFGSLLFGMGLYNELTPRAGFIKLRSMLRRRYNPLNEDEVQNRPADLPDDDRISSP